MPELTIWAFAFFGSGFVYFSSFTGQASEPIEVLMSEQTFTLTILRRPDLAISFASKANMFIWMPEGLLRTFTLFGEGVPNLIMRTGGSLRFIFTFESNCVKNQGIWTFTSFGSLIIDLSIATLGNALISVPNLASRTSVFTPLGVLIVDFSVRTGNTVEPVPVLLVGTFTSVSLLVVELTLRTLLDSFALITVPFISLAGITENTLISVPVLVLTFITENALLGLRVLEEAIIALT